MKNIIVLLAILFAIPQISIAQEGFSVCGSPTSVPLKDKKIRPKDNNGDAESVNCIYTNGVLTITFEEPEGRAVLTVTRMEDGMSESAAFYTFSTFTYNIGTAPGTYLLEIKTSKNCYEGTLTLE